MSGALAKIGGLDAGELGRRELFVELADEISADLFAAPSDRARRLLEGEARGLLHGSEEAVHHLHDRIAGIAALGRAAAGGQHHTGGEEEKRR